MKKLPKKRRIVSICGPSGSGKSFIVKKFTNYAQIGTDDFYIGKKQMLPNERGDYNFDAPDAVNLRACGEALTALASLDAGAKVIIPDYDMKSSEPRGTQSITVPDDQAIIIVEGIFSFHDPLLGMADFRIFMEPALEIILARRVRRDLYERGRTLDSVFKQYPLVMDGYNKYIKPMKKHADVVIDFGILV